MAPTILNAANEIAVEAFLNRRIGFLDIPRVVETTLNESPNANASVDTLDGVLAVGRASPRSRAPAFAAASSTERGSRRAHVRRDTRFFELVAATAFRHSCF